MTVSPGCSKPPKLSQLLISLSTPTQINKIFHTYEHKTLQLQLVLLKFILTLEIQKKTLSVNGVKAIKNSIEFVKVLKNDI